MTSYYKIIATDNLTFGESTDNLTLLEYYIVKWYWHLYIQESIVKKKDYGF